MPKFEPTTDNQNDRSNIMSESNETVKTPAVWVTQRGKTRISVQIIDKKMAFGRDRRLIEIPGAQVPQWVNANNLEIGGGK